MSRIFISHSSADREAAEDLCRRLEEDGHRVFLDFDPEDGIPAGSNWEQELYRRIRGCRAVVVLCSRRSMASKWCFMEITHARALGKVLFPVKIEECQLDRVLSDRQAVDLSADPEAGYDSLRQGILAAGIDPKDDFQWDGKRPPYPGLLAFQEKDAGLFFGRDREIGEGLDLLERVHRLAGTGWVMVLGASGSGKSSLVRAGLMPRLRHDKERWLVVGPVRPRGGPATALADALGDAFKALGHPSEAPGIHDLLRDACSRAEPPRRTEEIPTAQAESDEGKPRRAPDLETSGPLESLAVFEAELPGALRARVLAQLEGLRRALRRAAGVPEPRPAPPPAAAPEADNPILEAARRLHGLNPHQEARVLVVVDQFEELLERERERDGFLTCLRMAADEPGSPLVVLGTMRSDFLGQFQKHPVLRGLRLEPLQVGPMATAEIVRVIEGPAKVAGLELEPGLVQMLVEDAETDDALPLLAFTLRQLWERYGNRPQLTVAQYRDDLGRLQGSVAKTAEELTRRLHPSLIAGVRRALLLMVRTTEEGALARRTVHRTRLQAPPEVLEILDEFVDARLLVAGANGAEGTLEVAHEALFHSWGRLAGWLREDRERLEVAHQVDHAAAGWREADAEEKHDHLWTGGRLARALELEAEEELPLEEGSPEFLSASEAAQTLARSRKRRIRAAVLTGLITLTAIAGLSAFVAERARRASDRALQEARRQGTLSAAAALAGRALRQVQQHDDVELAALAARQAFLLNRQVGGPERDPLLDDAVRAVMAYPHPNQILRGHESRVYSVAISPDGGTVAAGGRNGTIGIWDLATKERTPRFLPAHEAKVDLLAFTSGGALLSAAEDGVRLWTLDSAPGPLRRLEDVGRLLHQTISGDGRWLFAAASDDTLYRWDLESGAAEPDLERKLEDAVRGMSASFDGSRLVLLYRDGLRVWEVGKEWGALLELSRTSRSVALNAAGDLAAIATGSRVMLWPLGPGTEPQRPEPLNLGHVRTPYAPTLDETGRWLAVGGLSAGDILVWDLAAIDPDDLESGEGVEPFAILRGHARSVLALTFHQDLLVSGSGDRSLRLWDWRSRDSARLPDLKYVTSLAFRGGDEEPTLVAAPVTSILQWRFAARPDTVTTVADPPGSIGAMALDPQGKRLLYLTSSGRTSSVVLVPDLDAPDSEHRQLATLDQKLHAVSWAPAGDLAAWAGEGRGGIRVIKRPAEQDAEQITLPLDRPRPRIKALAFNRTGWLAAAGEWRDPDQGVLLFRNVLAEDATGVRLSTGGYSGGWQDASFNPAGDVLAVCGGGGIVLVWRFASKEAEPPQPEVLPAHSGYVYAVAFDRDGLRLATGGEDGTAKVWDLADLGADPVAIATEDEIRSIAFSPDGRQLALGGKRQGVRIFELRLEKLAESLCDRAGRNLSQEEWERMVGGGIPHQETCP